MHTTEDERGVLRWGGLAGILGGILFILDWVVILVGPVGMEDPADLAGWPIRFPDIMAARVLENGIYLLALVLGVLLFVSLYRALRGANLAPALFGSVLGIVGLSVFMAGALPHVAHAPLSELYHTPGATPEDQAALALMWQATWGLFDALLYVGFFVVPAGILLLGIGMLGAADFGKALGWLSVVLGGVGIVAAVLQIADPASMTGAASYFAMVIFYLVLGSKVVRLSRTRSA